MTKLRVKLPRLYEKCLSCFAQCSVASKMNSYGISQETLSEVIIFGIISIFVLMVSLFIIVDLLIKG